MTDVRLEGCRPEPLASYLEALGILRLVAAQADPGARGFWEGDSFVLRSSLGGPELAGFLRDRYAPTPILGPWNGGSGFWPGDNTVGIDAITGSTEPRFERYRTALSAARDVIQKLRLSAKPSKDQKLPLIEALRSAVPDDALWWLDAALVLTDDGPKYPPLLGTGGNDGRLDFTNNFMQRLDDLLISRTVPDALLEASLFGGPVPDLLRDRAIGQFLPAAAGGANAGAGFDRKSLLNPWDYVLMLEGAVAFGAAATRRLEGAQGASLAFPFTVRATGAGYGSGSLADEKDTRDELWLPLWSRPTAANELRAVFAEGRAKVRSGAGGRSAATGVDFARAIGSVGVQRGLDGFVRYGFHQRSGLTYFAVPLGRFRVRSTGPADLLAPLDGWLQFLRRRAGSDKAPTGVRRALRTLEEAILVREQQPGPDESRALLVTLGELEAALARSLSWTADNSLRPVPALEPRWLSEVRENDATFRLAVALAAAGLRERLVPVRQGRWSSADDGRTVWTERPLVANLHRLIERSDLEELGPPVGFALLGDVARFVAGEVDDDRLEALTRGLTLLDWSRVQPIEADRSEPLPPAAFAVMTLARGLHPVSGERMKATPGLVTRAAAGDSRALDLAVRRLRGAGLGPAFDDLREAPAVLRRCAAALAFPLSASATPRLAHSLGIANEEPLTPEAEHV